MTTTTHSEVLPLQQQGQSVSALIPFHNLLHLLELALLRRRTGDVEGRHDDEEEEEEEDKALEWMATTMAPRCTPLRHRVQMTSAS